MANILLLTNVYPLKDVKLYGSTSVCHYFVKEWQNKGDNIRVIYNYTIYTRILHYFAKKYDSMICSLFPTVINSEYYSSPFEYSYEGIKVLLNPIYKFMPKLSFTNKSINNAFNQITKWLIEEDFKPDIILGHFLHPNFYLLPKLKDFYNCPVALIAHGKYNQHTDNVINTKNIKEIDLWGFRSIPIQNSFTRIFKIKNHFLCFSGVPEQFISFDSWSKHNSDQVSTFLFVGNLINRKYPYVIAKSFSSFADPNDKLTIIGSGSQEHKILKFIHNNSIEKQISLVGRLSREHVRCEMIKNQVFIMISKNETFGLVYIEAMACGCIVIASRGEGMDGIIMDGVNGFLCESGNEKELTDIVRQIKSLHRDEKIKISRNAIETAKRMTDKKIADAYYSEIVYSMTNS